MNRKLSYLTQRFFSEEDLATLRRLHERPDDRAEISLEHYNAVVFEEYDVSPEQWARRTTSLKALDYCIIYDSRYHHKNKEPCTTEEDSSEEEEDSSVTF